MRKESNKCVSKGRGEETTFPTKEHSLSLDKRNFSEIMLRAELTGNCSCTFMRSLVECCNSGKHTGISL